jgi:hypothetical protein
VVVAALLIILAVIVIRTATFPALHLG